MHGRNERGRLFTERALFSLETQGADTFFGVSVFPSDQEFPRKNEPDPGAFIYWPPGLVQVIPRARSRFRRRRAGP